jgi:hypothetical protein
VGESAGRVFMIRILFDLGLFGLFTATISSVLAVVGLLRFLRQRPVKIGASYVRPVSLLKPLDGAEPDLEAHIETFFKIIRASKSFSAPVLRPTWHLQSRAASLRAIRMFPRASCRPGSGPTLTRKCRRWN